MLQRTNAPLVFANWLITPLILTSCFLEEPVDSTNDGNPTISGSPPGVVKIGANYSFTPAASNPDSDPMVFSVSNMPHWANFNSMTGHLSGVPNFGSEGAYADIVISVSAGSLSTSMHPFLIVVEPATTTNLPPEIDGSPAAGVTVGEEYLFAPSAFDPDGDPMTFKVHNLPVWAKFGGASGRLSGIPQPGDEGSYADISISVSDGAAGASMPAFSVVVEAPNSAPVVSGKLESVATVNMPYAFQVSAVDPDGDTLTFSVDGLPVWASFDAATGRVYGTPGAADVGTYGGIVITVSDGRESVSFGPHTITVESMSMGSVTLNWVAPTENVDGSPLVDLAGYKLLWGNSPGVYVNSVTIDNPGITTYVIENLAPGTYEFVAIAFNAIGAESAYSSAAMKTVP